MSETQRKLEAQNLQVTRKMSEAAQMVAVGKLKHKEIARQLKVSPSLLSTWLHDEKFAKFQKLVQSYQDRYAQQVFTRGAARREVRVDTLADIRDRILQVIDERAEELKTVKSGGASGILAHDVKGVGYGINSEIVDVYRFDAALIEKLMDVQREIAEELGQRVERKEVSGSIELSVVDALHEGRARVAAWRKAHADAKVVPMLPAGEVEGEEAS